MTIDHWSIAIGILFGIIVAISVILDVFEIGRGAELRTRLAVSLFAGILAGVFLGGLTHAVLDVAQVSADKGNEQGQVLRNVLDTGH